MLAVCTLFAKPNGLPVREFGLLLVVDRGHRLRVRFAAVVGGSTVVACG